MVQFVSMSVLLLAIALASLVLEPSTVFGLQHSNGCKTSRQRNLQLRDNQQNSDANYGSTNQAPSSPKINYKRGLLQGGLALIGGTFLSVTGVPSFLRAASNSQFPIYGPESLMSKKEHGTSSSPVQQKLRWNCDVKVADKICNFNRNWAEFAGYWARDTTFLAEADPNTVTTFYDSVTGKPLFRSPVGRSFEQWKDESMVHGWPSFRDDEVTSCFVALLLTLQF